MGVLKTAKPLVRNQLLAAVNKLHSRHNRFYALHRIGGIAGFIRLGIFALSPLHDSPHLARRHGPSETKTNHDDQKYPHHGQILPTTLITCPLKGPAVAAAKHD